MSDDVLDTAAEINRASIELRIESDHLAAEAGALVEVATADAPSAFAKARMLESKGITPRRQNKIAAQLERHRKLLAPVAEILAKHAKPKV
jgi:hypothetical protein